MARRSLLFTPGDRPEMHHKAPTYGADTIVFDLEDAVAPGRKDEAREAVHGTLADPDFDPDCEVGIRVNPDARADVEAVVDGDVRLDVVMLPKVSSAAAVDVLADLLAEAGRELPVLAIVESSRGVLAAREIAAADATDMLCFGAEDLSADLGATRTDEGTEVLYAREHTVMAARAEGVGVQDTVYTDFDDLDGLREDAAFARDLGFDGKAAIHPAQVSVINEAFTPDPEQVEWARKVLAARETADADDRGVFEVEGEMVDAPLIARAERIVERAGAADRRPDREA